MTKGFFAHLICYQNRVYRKHILFMNEKNHITGIVPFSHETANTIFYDGILFVSSINFHPYRDRFSSVLKNKLEKGDIPLSQAILNNTVYRSYIPDKEDSCAVYNIPDICWENERPESPDFRIESIIL